MKTNIELAREAGAQIDRGSELLLCGSAIDRYTALVEARLMAKLLEGTGEPVAQLHPNHWKAYPEGSDWCREVLLYSPNNEGDKFRGVNTRVKLHTQAQIAAAVLRERREHKPNCKECEEWRDKLANAADNYRAINEGRAIIKRLTEDAIRNRGTK